MPLSTAKCNDSVRMVGITGRYLETLLEEINGSMAISSKPTSGESARFHWSDYRLVARHNFRVARQPGPKLEGHAFGRAKRNCQDRSRDIQRCAPNQLVGVSGM